MMCRASSVLPRAFDLEGSEWAQRGTETHAYLQRVGEGMSPEASLELVQERFREGCAALDLESLRDVLGMTPELALAYHPETDTARPLGCALEREYEAAGVRDDEIPMTVDVAGVDNPDAPRFGVVADYKRTWQRLTPAAKNWQMRFGALALARAYDLDDIRAQLIYLRDDLPAWRDSAVFTAADLAVFAAEARVRWQLALEDRARYAEDREDVPPATKGTWCRFCPSYHACDAQTGLIRALVAGTAGVELDTRSMDPDAVAIAFKRLRDLREPLKRVEQAIYAAARERPVLLEVLPDGQELWLGMHETVGNEKLDPEIARTVVREMLDEEAVDEVCTFAVTKGRLETAIKARVPRGHGAAKMKAILAEVRKRNGAHQPTKHEVTTYKIRRALPAKAG